ncbi:hypothetical protein [Flammeovirga sp. EKP202]|uniref:hypothetical protein n=1 Tax=Flammeovirga sp. EKP202 TaxID=2770592 RepID=UPI00165FDF9A|nr:hypothetical protein [Flammeovirga sp. EKP202]MBD0401323.1 hypothetical protein [Flammeovirga sp. EKP202]
MLKVLQFFILSIFIFSCSSDDNIIEDCRSTELSYINDVSLPSQGKVGEPIEGTIEYTLSNGCGQFSKLNQNIEGKTVTLSVEAVYEGCICTDIAPIGEVTFNFTPNETGEYKVIIESPDSNDKTFTIIISE